MLINDITLIQLLAVGNLIGCGLVITGQIGNERRLLALLFEVGHAPMFLETSLTKPASGTKNK